MPANKWISQLRSRCVQGKTNFVRFWRARVGPCAKANQAPMERRLHFAFITNV